MWDAVGWEYYSRMFRVSMRGGRYLRQYAGCM